MPPSIGLTHLRTRSKSQHTYEQRLSALEQAELHERHEFSRLWRNYGRPVPVSSAAAVSRPVTAPELVDLCVIPSSRHGRRPSDLHASEQLMPPAQHEQAVLPSNPPPGGFLSPPTTLVRGPQSFMENPQVTKRLSNDYFAYFKSALHDEDIARDLVRREHQSARRSSRRSGEQRLSSCPPQVIRVEGQFTDKSYSAADDGDDLGYAPLAPRLKMASSTRSQPRASGLVDAPHDSQQRQHLPDHIPDPVRLRQFKSKHADERVHLSALKPKCAVLHVKLEKLSRRMKAEDEEFAAFRDVYLRSLKHM